MNSDQLSSNVRSLLKLIAGTAIGGLLVKWGVPIDDNSLGVYAMLLAGVGGVVWSNFNHSRASTVAKAAAIVPIPALVQLQAGVAEPVTVQNTNVGEAK